MVVQFPERLAPLVEGKSCRIIAGMFSMSGQSQRTLYPGSSVTRSFSEYTITFRHMQHGQFVEDVALCTGTMNPAELTQGNQIAMLIVDIPKATGIVGEFIADKTNAANGEAMIVALWAPDGASGRFMVERENFFIEPWIRSAKQKMQFSLQIWGVILGVTMVTCIIGFILPCVFVLFPIFGAFFYKRYWRQRKDAGLVVPKDYPKILQAWVNSLYSQGSFQRAFTEAMGKPQGGQGGRL